MSGSPGSDPDAKYPSWVVNPWDGVYMDVLDYQWSVAVPFWKEIDALARDNDVRVAIEMHPHNLVFNAPTIKRLVEATGATNVGVEMDTSHLMWQQMDVSAGDPLARLPHLLRRRQGRRPLRRRQDPRGSSTPSSPACRPTTRTRCRPGTATGATPGPRTRPGASSPSASATRRLLDRGPARPARGRPRHRHQHRARGRLDVGARRAVDGGQDPSRGDRPALTRRADGWRPDADWARRPVAACSFVMTFD